MNGMADSREIKKNLVRLDGSSESGQLLFRDASGCYIKTGEAHSGIIGQTGCGKTTRGSMNTVIAALMTGKTLIASDEKGELYRATRGLAERNGYKVIVYDFRNPRESSGYSPLALIRELYDSRDPAGRDIADELAWALAESAMPDEGRDPFWPESARKLLVGCLKSLLECAGPEETTMDSAAGLILGGDTDLKRLVMKLPEGSEARRLMNGYLTTASETRGSEREVFLTKMVPFMLSEGIRKMTSENSLDFSLLDGSVKLAVYFIIPGENHVFHKLAGMMIGQIMTWAVKLAAGLPGGMLKNRMEFVLEECGNIGRAIPNLPFLITESRSRNIRITWVVQNIAQLEDIYGVRGSGTIISNTGIFMIFRSNDFQTMDHFAKLAGERMVGKGEKRRSIPRVSAYDIAALAVGQALVIAEGGLMYRLTLPHYSEIFELPEFPKTKENRSERGSCEAGSAAGRHPRRFDPGKYISDRTFGQEPERTKAGRETHQQGFFPVQPVHVAGTAASALSPGYRRVLEELRRESERMADMADITRES